MLVGIFYYNLNGFFGTQQFIYLNLYKKMKKLLNFLNFLIFQFKIFLLFRICVSN